MSSSHGPSGPRAPSGPTLPVRIDIVSDVVCPWCIIGFRQLGRAIAGHERTFEVDLHWHPFELNPHMPPGGQDLVEHVAEKYGSTPAQSRAARERVSRLGQELEFDFRYFDGMRIFNTFDAHQMLHWARENAMQTPLELALFEAYFTHQEDVSDRGVLQEVAERCGLCGSTAREVLEDQRYARNVRDDEQLWRSHGIDAVPAFVFDRRYLVMGAQGSQIFTELFAKLSLECHEHG